MRRREPHGRVFVGTEHGELDHVPDASPLRRVHEVLLPLDSVWAGGRHEKRLLGALERLGVGEVRNYGLYALPLHGTRLLGAAHHRAHRCPRADQLLDHQAPLVPVAPDTTIILRTSVLTSVTSPDVSCPTLWPANPRGG